MVSLLGCPTLPRSSNQRLAGSRGRSPARIPPRHGDLGSQTDHHKFTTSPCGLSFQHLLRDPFTTLIESSIFIGATKPRIRHLPQIARGHTSTYRPADEGPPATRQTYSVLCRYYLFLRRSQTISKTPHEHHASRTQLSRLVNPAYHSSCSLVAHDNRDSLSRLSKRRLYQKIGVFLRNTKKSTMASNGGSGAQTQAQVQPCRYKTGKTLGAGSYSVVKECVHIDTGRYYAAKVINKRLMAGREHMVRGSQKACFRTILMHIRSEMRLPC
jgi:hypothetical protein